MKLNKLIEKKAELLSQMEALVEGAEDNLTEEQTEEYEGLQAEYDATVKSIEVAENLEKAKADAAKDANRPVPAVKRVVEAQIVEAEDTAIVATTPKIIVPASALNVNLKVFKSPETAYSFGQYVKACIGDYQANQWCAEHGIMPKYSTAHNSTTDSQGGYLVPTEYSADILNLLNTYGIARKYCKVIPMSSDTFVRPKRLTGLTAGFVTQSSAATESNKTWGQIQLTVKDAVILSRMTKQLSADALVAVADDLALEIAYQFGAFEDDVLFNADGTATYKSIDGVYKSLIDDSRVDTTSLAAGSTLDSVTIAMLRKMVAKIPSYARKSAKWYVSPVVWDSVFNRLADAAGGNTNQNIQGGNELSFLGYPVVLSDSCNTDGVGSPSADPEGSVIVVFGSMEQAVDFGDRQSVQIDFSDSATVGGESVFERSQIAVRGIERFDINVHSTEALYGLQLDTVA